jgi:hypothetical protein
VLVLKNLRAGNLAAQNLGEDVVRVVGHDPGVGKFFLW